MSSTTYYKHACTGTTHPGNVKLSGRMWQHQRVGTRPTVCLSPPAVSCLPHPDSHHSRCPARPKLSCLTDHISLTGCWFLSTCLKSAGAVWLPNVYASTGFAVVSRGRRESHLGLSEGGVTSKKGCATKQVVSGWSHELTSHWGWVHGPLLRVRRSSATAKAPLRAAAWGRPWAWGWPWPWGRPWA